jgi:hypothetical protein
MVIPKTKKGINQSSGVTLGFAWESEDRQLKSDLPFQKTLDYSS